MSETTGEQALARTRLLSDTPAEFVDSPLRALEAGVWSS